MKFLLVLFSLFLCVNNAFAFDSKNTSTNDEIQIQTEDSKTNTPKKTSLSGLKDGPEIVNSHYEIKYKNERHCLSGIYIPNEFLDKAEREKIKTIASDFFTKHEVFSPKEKAPYDRYNCKHGQYFESKKFNWLQGSLVGQGYAFFNPGAFDDKYYYDLRRAEQKARISYPAIYQKMEESLASPKAGNFVILNTRISDIHFFKKLVLVDMIDDKNRTFKLAIPKTMSRFFKQHKFDLRPTSIMNANNKDEIEATEQLKKKALPKIDPQIKSIETLKGKHIQVRGFIGGKKNNEIEIYSPWQIEVLK